MKITKLIATGLITPAIIALSATSAFPFPPGYISPCPPVFGLCR